MPLTIPPGWAASVVLSVLAALPLSSCANADTAHANPTTQEAAMKTGVEPMLEAIYSSQKPVGFEQLDVSSIVSEYFPIGTDKSAVLDALGKSSTSKVIEDTAEKVVVRDNRGQAMLDPDARSVVMTFDLDASGKVARIEALHLKNQ